HGRQVEQPRGIVARATGSDLPSADLRLPYPRGIVACDQMMKIVKSYGGNPRLGIWNVETQRTDFEIYPTRGIAAIIETVGSKILRAGIDQPKLIGVVRHSNTTTACSTRDCVVS